MKTVFLFIPKSVYTSDLLRTGYLEYASTRFKLVVLLPFKPEELTVLRYPRLKNVAYHVWPEEPSFFRHFKVARTLLVNQFDYLRNTTVLMTRDAYADSLGAMGKTLRGVRRFATRVGITISPTFFTRLERVFMPRSKLFAELVRTYRPALVATASPGFVRGEAEIILSAKRHGIPTVAVNFSWDNLSSKANRLRRVDYLLLWNDFMQEEAIGMHGYSPERAFVSGSMRFDHYFSASHHERSREEFLRNKGLDPARKTVLLTTCSPGTYNKHRALIQSILSWRDEGKIKAVVNLYIRPHPKDNERYDDFMAAGNVYVDHGFTSYKLPDGSKRSFLEMTAADLAKLKATLKASDLNINCASTISLEACIFDTPVINIFTPIYYERYHYKPIVQSGAVRLVHEGPELLGAINFYLEHPEAQRRERKALVERYIQFRDGLSYKRNADFIADLLGIS